MIFPNSQATTYNDKVVRQFAIMTVVWGVVGMLVGVIVAAQLAFPELNLGIPWLTYGRLRPLHTNAVIFALVVVACLLLLTMWFNELAMFACLAISWPLSRFGVGNWLSCQQLLLCLSVSPKVKNMLNWNGRLTF